MISRRTFLGLLTAGPFAASRVAEAQTGKVYRVGYLSPSSAGVPAVVRSVEEFRQGLRELGWLEGQNIVIEYRFADGQFQRLSDLAAELIRSKVDVIVANPTPAAVAAKNATATIPIVMVNAGDPVGVGLVASLARPGGNVTGLSWAVETEIFGKSLELLKTALPELRRVAVLSNPGNPSHVLVISNLKVAAQSLGLELQFLTARGPGDLDSAFGTMVKERAAAVLVVADSLFLLHRA